MQDFVKRFYKKQIIVFLLIIFSKLTTWIVTNHIVVELLILKTHMNMQKKCIRDFLLFLNDISLCLRPNIRLIRQLCGLNFDFNVLNGQIYPYSKSKIKYLDHAPYSDVLSLF